MKGGPRGAPVRTKPTEPGKITALRRLRPVTAVIDVTQDEVLASRLVDDLEFRHGVDVSTIDISVRDGRGLVRGIVSDGDELESIKDTIQDEQGINDLEVQLQIAPTRREEDRDHARAVQEAIDAEPDLGSADIQVACMNRVVVLRGRVGTALHKVKAGLLALRQPDVSRVRNRLVVDESRKGASRRER